MELEKSKENNLDEMSQYLNMQSQAKEKVRKSRSRERVRRGMTTMDHTHAKQSHTISKATVGLHEQRQRGTFDDLKSRATDILLPTDYLNSRSSSNSSNKSSSQISNLISKTSQFTDVSKLQNLMKNN